jgi:lysozyme
MLSNAEIAERLEFHEGRKAESYYCSGGYLTQGIGHNLEANPLTKDQKSKIKDLNHWTDAEIDMILADDVYQCKVLMTQLIDGFEGFDDERQYALVDMCFQLGAGGVAKFKKMLKAMREKDWEEAERQCLDSKYARQTPVRARRIAHLIKTGEWKKKLEDKK